MYNNEKIHQLIAFIRRYNGINDKAKLQILVAKEFSLVKDRSVYYCEDFAIRFSKAERPSFSNTVLSLSSLQKYDNAPFIVCLVTPTTNFLLLANTTFLKKISHSSQELRIDNIKGSFNGSDILRKINDVKNEPENFEYLYSMHENFTFEENLARLVEETNKIVATGKKFEPNKSQLGNIIGSVARSIEFIKSNGFTQLDIDLQERVESVKSEIIIASLIENVNLRGRVIEYLITEEDSLKDTLINCLKSNKPLPKILTEDKLGDYEKDINNFHTATDIKTKVMFLSSNPKGYNIDKLLEFLSEESSVYFIYLVGIDNDNSIITRLVSVFDSRLIDGTQVIHHWAGRHSRGVTQYNGKVLEEILNDQRFLNEIDEPVAENFILSFLNK